MRDTPRELVIALAFGTIWLAQLVYKWVQRRTATLPSDVEPMPMPVPEAEAEDDILAPPDRTRPDRPAPPARIAAAPAKLVEALWVAPVAVNVRTVATPRPLTRRFSKAALMPGRRAVQDAVVIAAILESRHLHPQ